MYNYFTVKEENDLDQIAKENAMTSVNTETNVAENEILDSVMTQIEEIEALAAEEIEEIVEDDGLDLDGLDDVNEIEELSADGAEDLSDDDLAELEREENKAAAYASQESTATGATSTITATGTVSTKRASSGAPRTPRDMATVPADCFVLSGDVSSMSDADKNAAKTAVMATTPGQKKVAEKFEHLFHAMQAGRAPSVYVMTAFAALEAKKELSSAEIVAAFKTSGVGEGTARSQSGQIMVLFPVLGIADRAGKSLKLRADSNIAEYLRKHLPA